MAEPLRDKQYYTKEEYLDMEALAEYKSEYYDGEIFAMSGGSPNHSTICFNLIRRIGEATDDKDCRGFESNMKLEIAAADACVYPDIMVVCGDIEFAENTEYVLTNPMLIIEVLSPSTESFDRGRKFEYYRTTETLKEYVLISQDKPMAEVYFRQDKKAWLYSAVRGLDSKVTFQSLEHEFALKDIYQKCHCPGCDRKVMAVMCIGARAHFRVGASPLERSVAHIRTDGHVRRKHPLRGKLNGQINVWRQHLRTEV